MQLLVLLVVFVVLGFLVETACALLLAFVIFWDRAEDFFLDPAQPQPIPSVGREGVHGQN
jgi:hypothetical protein